MGVVKAQALKFQHENAVLNANFFSIELNVVLVKCMCKCFDEWEIVYYFKAQRLFDVLPINVIPSFLSIERNTGLKLSCTSIWFNV